MSGKITFTVVEGKMQGQLFVFDQHDTFLFGRMDDCHILLKDDQQVSRHHCILEINPQINPPVISIRDLGSKNGTHVGEGVITRHVLNDADIIGMGKSTVRFHRGAFVPGPKTKPQASRTQRPADPFEALSGTVTAFEFEPRGPARNTERLPTPRPGPPEPAAYDRENVRSMVSGLVSSSWDSIYDHARRPDPLVPQSPMVENLRRNRPREPRVDPSLQVRPEGARQQRTKASPALLERPRPRGRIRALLRRLATFFQ